MLTFAHPWAFSLLALLLPVAILYFLRMRFKRQPVGSAFIWRRIAGKNSGGNRLKYRSLLLLFLQIAAVCLAALSAAGPSWESRRLLKPGVAFIIDASASMSALDAATDGERAESRFERAKRLAAEEIRALPPDTPVMVFSGSFALKRLWSGLAGSRAAKAVEDARQEQGAFLEDEASLTLQSSMTERQGSWRAVVFTDGGMDLEGRRIASAFESAAEFRDVGQALADSGVAGLSVAATLSGGTATFTLRNGTGMAITRGATLALDGRELASFEASIPPGETRSSVSFAQAPGYGAYELSLAGEDGYALNDSCYLALNPVRELAVLSVGQPNPYLAAALAYQGIRAASMAYFPDSLDPDDWDIVISNGTPPPEGLECNLALFGTVAPDAPVRASGNVSGYLDPSEGGHPLGRFLRWDDGATGSGAALETGPGVEEIARIGDAAVMAAWEKDGFRYFTCSLDLGATELGLSQAFPVLMRNLMQWFVPGQEGESAYTLRVGEGVWRSEGSSFAVDDERVEATVNGTRAFVRASSLGVFAWTARGRQGSLAANLPFGELDPAPRSLERPAGEQDLSAVIIPGTQEFARLPVLLLLAALALEWIIWNGLPPPGAKKGWRREDAR